MSGQGKSPRVLVVEHETRCGLGRLDPLPGCDLMTVRPYLGELLPPDLQGVDGLVVLGGSMDAWDDEAAPWLPRTRALLAQGVQDGVPVLGICLGAQLLALATGGQVARGGSGPELGLLAVMRTDAGRDDAMMTALPDAFLVPQAHYDEIARLPEGAQVLASSALYANQVFRVGEAAWGVQYHPEVDEDDFAGWMVQDAPALAEQGRTPDQVVEEIRGARELLDAAARLHAEAFAGIVRGRVVGRP